MALKPKREIPALTPFETVRFYQKIRIHSRRRRAHCWEWEGMKRSGYGIISFGSGRRFSAHRVSFFIHKKDEALDPLLVIDHTCRNRGCVNPAHLRQVSYRVNVLENSNARPALNVRKTKCSRGHSLSGENLIVKERDGGRRNRACIACQKIRSRIGYLKKKKLRHGKITSGEFREERQW